ncbi:hypothetical protein FACS1894132_06140 [Clostridia bacterium]|nr:hypothetical protein FACS1894132_06140 [Clostridia bacterium]
MLHTHSAYTPSIEICKQISIETVIVRLISTESTNVDIVFGQTILTEDGVYTKNGSNHYDNITGNDNGNLFYCYLYYFGELLKF